MPQALAQPRVLKSDLFRIYLPTIVCFLVINVTNAAILPVLQHHHMIYGADPNALIDFEKTTRFFLVPAKSFLFLVSTAILFLPLIPAFRHLAASVLHGRYVRKTLTSLFLCLVLTATFFPLSFGRQYARISTDPFNQDVGQLYRRVLIPGLAYLYHVNGFFYGFLVWVIVLIAALAMRAYFLSHSIDLSVLEEVSLLTVGIFAASFQVPGYPEVAVLLLGLVALMEYERDGHFTAKQLAAFSLALMAHEACAIMIFAPMILFFFGRRSWLPTASIAVLYGIAVLANFHFNIFVPLAVQTTVGEIPAQVYFYQYPNLILAAAGYAFKALWLLVPVALYSLMRVNRRAALFVVCGLALAFASTYVAVDYSRLIGFATIPVLVCLVQARRSLAPRVFTAIMTLNIMIPSFFVGGNVGLLTFRGLYYEVFRHIFKLPPSGIHS